MTKPITAKIIHTSERQSDDMLKGRIIAMKSMIAQFTNEIEQLESNLKSRQSRRICPACGRRHDR